MTDQLAGVIRGLDSAEARLEKLAESIPADRWPLRHDPERWSVAECVAHLNLTSAAYIPLIRAAIAEARQARAGGQKTTRYKRDPVGWFFSTMTGPVPSLGRFRFGRVKTTADFIPIRLDPQQTLLVDFKRHQLELTGMAREGDGLALDKVFITSPFGGRLRYNCYSAFVILPRHQERHLDQAERVWTD